MSVNAAAVLMVTVLAGIFFQSAVVLGLSIRISSETERRSQSSTAQIYVSLFSAFTLTILLWLIFSDHFRTNTRTAVLGSLIGALMVQGAWWIYQHGALDRRTPSDPAHATSKFQTILPSGPGVFVLPPLSRVVAPIAGTSNERRSRVPTVKVEWHEESGEIRCTLREDGRNDVRVFLEADRDTAEMEVCPLVVSSAGGQADYLVILVPEHPGPHVGDIRVPARGAVVNTALLRPRVPDSLSIDDIAAVVRSLRLTSREGREAWRRLAAARMSDDPLRTAIEAEI
jgi:hypothetical protein